jgi:exodeoxyribonuclease VII large subunit
MFNYSENTSEPQSVLDFLTGINASLISHRGRVEGEVTSVKNTYQTAIYFSIKDLEKDALLNCVIWRSTYNQNGVSIKEGDKIIVTGVPEIFAARGSFSMKVQTIEYAGEGVLKKSYDELKRKLEVEGFLATDRKRVLPDYPKKIGVITSRSGVVIQDFNSNLGRYGFNIIMVDSRVEGKDAIHELLAALKTMAKQDIDVLVIMRGGGSWESLQSFNTESVVRAIADFKCPVLTGIGHDVDVTLSELVADVGASTPTAVAEALNETWDTLKSSLDVAEARILNSYRNVLTQSGRTLEQSHTSLLRRFEQSVTLVRNNLTQSSQSIQRSYRSLEKIITEVNSTFTKLVTIMRSEIKVMQLALVSAEITTPSKFKVLVRKTEEEMVRSAKYILSEQGRVIRQVGQILANVEQNIKTHDPARNLKLGYSLSYLNGKLVRSVKDLFIGEEAEIMLHDGSFTSEIKKII